MKPFVCHALLGAVLLVRSIGAAEAPKPGMPAGRLADSLRSLDVNVLTVEQRRRATQMFRDETRTRIRAFNQHDREAWEKIQTRDDWDQWTRPRLEALRKSLGIFPVTSNTPLRDLNGSAVSVCFTPNQQFVLTGSQTYEAQLWPVTGNATPPQSFIKAG